MSSGSLTIEPSDECMSKEDYWDLQIDNSDAVIINTKQDKQQAKQFQKHLEDNVRLNPDNTIHPKIILIDEIPGADQNDLSIFDIAFNKANYIFLFVTKHLCDSRSILSKLKSILMQDTERKKKIIPVNTKSKKEKDYHLEPMYSGVKCIEYWSRDQFLMNSVQSSFNRKIAERIQRDKELEDKRKKYIRALKNRKTFQQLDNNPCLHDAIASPMAAMPERLGNLDLQKAHLRSYEQTQSTQLRGMHLSKRSPMIRDPSLDSSIQIDGPTGHLPMHSSTFGQFPKSAYGLSEIPLEQHSHIPLEQHSHIPFEHSSQREYARYQTVSSLPYSSSQITSETSQSLSSSLEAQAPASRFSSQISHQQQNESRNIHDYMPSSSPYLTSGPQVLNYQTFANVHGQLRSHQPTHVYPSHAFTNTHSQQPMDLSQFIQLPGLPSQSHGLTNPQIQNPIDLSQFIQLSEPHSQPHCLINPHSQQPINTSQFNQLLGAPTQSHVSTKPHSQQSIDPSQSQFIQSTGATSQSCASTNHNIQSSKPSGQTNKSPSQPVINFTINIKNLGSGAFGHQAQLIHKHYGPGNEDEDGDDNDSENDSSESDANSPTGTEREDRSQEEPPLFTRSLGCGLTTADGNCHLSSARQPDSHNLVGISQPNHESRYNTSSDVESTHVKGFHPAREVSRSHETQVKHVDEGDLGFGDETRVKTICEETFETRVKSVDDETFETRVKRVDEETFETRVKNVDEETFESKVTNVDEETKVKSVRDKTRFKSVVEKIFKTRVRNVDEEAGVKNVGEKTFETRVKKVS